MTQEVAEQEKYHEAVPVQKGEGLRRGNVHRMIDQVDQMMADWWRRPFPHVLQPSPAVRGEPWPLPIPAVDVYEKQEEVVLKAEIPGLSKEDIKIELSGDSKLTISGEKKKEEDVKEENYTFSERSYGTFTRSLSMPCAVIADQAKATFHNGVLEVKLPKTEEAKKRRISVQIE